jgi:hypothetical protein
MRKLLVLSLAAGASVTLGACTDSLTSPDARLLPTPARGTIAAQPPDGSSERQTVSRYSVQIDADGPFVPGKKIKLTVTTTNHLDARAAELSLVLPEAVEARRRGWKRGVAPVGTRIAPDLRQTQTMRAGESTITRTSVEFAAPGLYRVIANVNAGADAPLVDAGRLVQNGASQEIWIAVDAKGGKTQSRYDRSLVPSGAVAEPGPTAMMVPICDELNPCDPPPDDPPPPPPSYNVLVTYFNNGTGHQTVEPLKNVTVRVSDYPSGASYSGQTNAAGYFSVPCPANPAGSQRITVTLGTPGQFQIQNYWSSAVWTVVDVVEPAGFCSGGGTTTVQATDIGAAWFHQQMLATVQPSRSTFQLSRGFVGVNYDVDRVHNNSLYRPDIDQIVLNPDHLYTEFGRFTVSHEYGHAFAEASLSGARGGGCPSSGHALSGAYTMLCAVSEGWADYHGVIVRRYEVPSYYTYMLYNWYYPGGDGSTIEGAFANFLLALTSPDPVGTVGDRGLHYPASYAAATLRDCRTRMLASQLWIVATAADQLVFCFEGGVDWGVYSSYFPTRTTNTSFRPALQTNPAPRPWNWSQANIRSAWLMSLYGVGS